MLPSHWTSATPASDPAAAAAVTVATAAAATDSETWLRTSATVLLSAEVPLLL